MLTQPLEQINYHHEFEQEDRQLTRIWSYAIKAKLLHMKTYNITISSKDITQKHSLALNEQIKPQPHENLTILNSCCYNQNLFFQNKADKTYYVLYNCHINLIIFESQMIICQY